MQAFYAIPDAWLAEMMRRPVHRIVAAAVAPAGAVMLSALSGGAGFQYAKLPVAAVARANELENAGFRYVDTALQFGMSAITTIPGNASGIRHAANGDRVAVADLARSSFVWSRFHQDPAVPADLANEIKASWAANYFSGMRGDHMIVAESGGRIVGFLQLLHAAGDLVIDLIAVAAEARGRGLAGAMIRHAAQTCGTFGRLVVGTQAANAESVKVYQRLGFQLMTANLILHRHSRNEAN